MIDIFGNPDSTIITCNNAEEMRVMVGVLVERGVYVSPSSTPYKVYNGDNNEWEQSNYHHIILSRERVDGYLTTFNRELAERCGYVILTFGEAIAALAKQQMITESEFNAGFDALMA